MALKRASLSDQVLELLRERIDNGFYMPGARLPSIPELIDELDVGRSTVREALKQLEIMGLVSIQHGKGTFVKERGIDFSSHLMSFSQSIYALGLRPGAQVLTQSVEPAGLAIAEKLEIAPGTDVNHLVRLRLADELPMALENSYTPAALLPGLTDRDDLDGSLYDIIDRIYDLHIVFATRAIEAVLTRGDENKWLGLRGRQPGLLIETVAFDRTDRPIEYGKSLYRADRYKFIIRQTRA